MLPSNISFQPTASTGGSIQMLGYLMFPSKEKRMQRWTVTRAKGMRRFIFVNGVLGWGLMTGISWSLVMWLVGAMPNPSVQLPVALVFFPLIGVAWGWFVWRTSEKAFVAHEQQAS